MNSPVIITPPPSFSLDLSVAEDAELVPGDYLIEIDLALAIEIRKFFAGLASQGWSNIILNTDEEAITLESLEEEGTGRPRAPVPKLKAGPARFIGSLEASIAVQNTDRLRWITAHKIGFDPFSNLNLQLTLSPLLKHKTYEVRFLARMKSEPKREDVLLELSKMGWRVLKVSLLKKDMRIPGKPNAAVSSWYGLLYWEKASSIITDQEPFFFEELREVHLPTSP